MRVFTGCSGVGAPEQAIKNLGLDWDVVGYSEIDKYAIQTYEKHFKGVKNYGDITRINEKELPDFDIFVVGFPCQSFSVAGRRGGFEDTRGTIFFDIARIAKHKKPRCLVLENVKGLLSHDGGKTFQTILKVLSETGYDVSWSIHNSKDYGVPQNRERIYIIGHLRGGGRPEVLPLGGDDKTSLTYVGGILSKESKQWLDDGKSFSRNFSQGSRVYDENGLSTTLAAQAGGLGAKTGLYRVISQHNSRRTVSISDTTVNTLTSSYRGSPDGDGRPGIIVAQRGRGNPPRQKLEPRRDSLTNTLTSVQKDNLVSGDPPLGRGARIRKLTPVECERLQGFPDGHTEGVSNTQRYKQMGNSMTVQVLEHIFTELIDDTRAG